MFKSLTQFFETARERDARPAGAGLAAEDATGLRVQLQDLDRDPYLCLADTRLNLISVFDDLRYDRADMDMMSGPMRRRIADKLTPLGFRQSRGGLFEHETLDVRMHLPKFRALGASPFDAARDTVRQPQDYLVLTPTQTACQIIDHYPVEQAVAALKTLIVKHPVNLLRISDYLGKTPAHRAIYDAIGHLRYVQREAVEREPLCRRRALR